MFSLFVFVDCTSRFGMNSLKHSEPSVEIIIQKTNFDIFESDNETKLWLE